MLTDDLSPLERDALTELVNIAVSGAASRLRVMVGSEVGLSVPIVEILATSTAANALAGFRREILIAVQQAFEGRLSGQTMLLFNIRDGQTLVRAVLGEGYSEEAYTELQDDTLGEIGNVLLLGLLATIGSMLGLTFDVAIPTVRAARTEQVFPAYDERVVMLIHVDFSVGQINARGYFALVLGLGSFAALREVIGVFLTDLLDGDAED